MSKEQYLPLVVQAAQKYGLNPTMLAAQVEQESGWNPKAKSSAGAMGLGQFMPSTAKARGIDPLNPAEAINGIAAYMAELKNKFGNEDLARMAYNAGEGRIGAFVAGKGKPLTAETQNYNKLIAGRAEKLAKDVGVAPTKQAEAAPSTETKQAQLGTDDALKIALAEMNTGAAPGTGTAMMQPQQPDWRQALAQLNTTGASLTSDMGSGVDYTDMIGQMKDQATQSQDRVLGSMFADITGGAQQDTSNLPSAVDRYLDKILA